MLGQVQNRLKEQDYDVEFDNTVKEYIAKKGIDTNYGARPLKRFVQKKLETLIAKKILAQEILPNTTVKIDRNQEGLFISCL